MLGLASPAPTLGLTCAVESGAFAGRAMSSRVSLDVLPRVTLSVWAPRARLDAATPCSPVLVCRGRL